MDTIWLEIALIVVAILANGYFAGSEIAVVSSRVSRLESLREAGQPGAASALRLKEAPDAFLATIQIAITSVATLASAVGGAAAVEALTPLLAGLPLPGAAQWAEPAALGAVVVLITYVSLVLGELVPKALALRNPERLACFVARPVEFLSRASNKLVRLLTTSTNLVLLVLGQSRVLEAPPVSEDDVRYLVREGAARGVFEREEAALVHRVFEFTDTTVREIMIPRHRVLGVEVATPPGEVMARLAQIGKSRMPVYRDSIEYTIGVITLKDVVRALAQGEALDLARLATPALFVPEMLRVSRLLEEFRRTGREFAMVVDEYGSIVGAVTLEDVLGEIVAGIPGVESDSVGMSGVSRLPNSSYLLDGSVSAEDVRTRLGVPIPESEDYQTVAGFILFRLEAVPTPGVSLDLPGWRLTVVDMDGPRIARIKAQRMTP
jgi:magnesium and cobalt exporter, CNNM family